MQHFIRVFTVCHSTRLGDSGPQWVKHQVHVQKFKIGFNLIVIVLQTPKQKGNPKLGSKPPMSEPLKKKKKTMIDYDEDSDASDVSFSFLSHPLPTLFTIELVKIWSKLLKIHCF